MDGSNLSMAGIPGGTSLSQSMLLAVFDNNGSIPTYSHSSV